MTSIQRFFSFGDHRTSKTGIAVLFLIVLIAADGGQNSSLSKYKRIEGYIIRPGVLLIPHYSEDGQLCETELESEHFVDGKVILSSSLTSEKVDEIVDELAPPAQRGDLLGGPGGRDSASFSGGALVTYRNFTNLSVSTYTAVSRGSISDMKQIGDPITVIVWKDRKCK